MQTDHLPTIIFDLLFHGRAPLRDTSEFKALKHNADLVPAVDGRLDKILDFLDRYRKVSYDIQGILDHGIDVLLTYDFNSEQRLIGFQVKSYDDLEQPEWLSKLKAQLLDVQTYHNSKSLVDFYVLFCTDGAIHRDKIRNATGAIVRNEYFKTHVITPDRCLHFLKLRDTTVGAYLKNKLSEEDYVLRNARESFDDLTLAQGAMVVDGIVSHFFDGRKPLPQDFARSSFVRQVYAEYPNLPLAFFRGEQNDPAQRRQLIVEPTADVQRVLDASFFRQESDDHLHFQWENHSEVVALLFEAKARYDYRPGELRSYLFDTLLESKLSLAREVISAGEVDATV